jgi:DNA-directed RNA polymerase subunit RPC12/RpoP
VSIAFRFDCEICTTEVAVGDTQKYSGVHCPKCGQEYGYDEGLAIVLTEEQKLVLRKHQEAQVSAG